MIRMTVAASLLWSSLLLYVGSWSVVGDKGLARLQTFYATERRTIAGQPRGRSTLTDQEVFERLRAPAMLARLRGARLIFFARVGRTAPDIILALAQQLAGTFDWVAAMVPDLKWLVAAADLPAQDHPPPELEALDQWLALAIGRPATWSLLIQRAVRASGTREGVLLAFTESFVVDGAFACEVCAQVFASLRILKSHRARIHGHRNPVRSFIENGCCPVCMADLWSRPRLLHHLRQMGKRFMHMLPEVRAPMPETEWRALDRADELERQRLRLAAKSQLWAERPSFKMPGPWALGPPRPPLASADPCSAEAVVVCESESE